MFLFCVEGLSNYLDTAAEEGKIHGCRISLTAPYITHLLFADDSFLFFNATTTEAMHIKQILERYANESCQAVNFLKFGVFYSSNVRRDKQNEIFAILGVHNDITTSNYLGLPSLIGRSKKRVFGFLRDRITKRIDSWKSKPIPRAMKSISIKNVSQVMPSYSMTCFLLPKSLLQEIERMFNAYWWKSESSNSRGVRWLSWDALCDAKCKGGMGFKNLFGFNVALLGKHIWRCIQYLDLLVSRVMRARYFPTCHIPEASKGSKASFI